MPSDPQWFANGVAIVAAIISGIALIAAGLSAYYSRRQAQAAEKQATEATASRQITEKAMADQGETLRRQSELAERSADAARRSATAAEESAKLAAHAHRAWLTVSGTRDELYLGTGDDQVQFSLVAHMINSGQTPASEVVLTQHIRSEFPSGTYEDHEPTRVECPSLGAGGATSICSVLKITSRDQLQQMKRIGHDVEVFGRADYRDVFGEQRVTRWHYLWDYSQGQFASQTDGTGLS